MLEEVFVIDLNSELLLIQTAEFRKYPGGVKYFISL